MSRFESPRDIFFLVLAVVVPIVGSKILYNLFSQSSSSVMNGMDAISVSHHIPKSVVVIHKIEFPELDAHKIFALQSSLRTLCITTCVVVSISVIAVCKYVVNPAITGRNYREMHERRRRDKDRRKASKKRKQNDAQDSIKKEDESDSSIDSYSDGENPIEKLPK